MALVAGDNNVDEAPADDVSVRTADGEHTGWVAFDSGDRAVAGADCVADSWVAFGEGPFVVADDGVASCAAEDAHVDVVPSGSDGVAVDTCVVVG